MRKVTNLARVASVLVNHWIIAQEARHKPAIFPQKVELRRGRHFGEESDEFGTCGVRHREPRHACLCEHLRCDLGFRVQGVGFRVQGSWFRVQGSGIRS